MPIVGYAQLGDPGDVPGEARGSDREDMFTIIGYGSGMTRKRERQAQGDAVTGQVLTHDVTLIKYNCLASINIMKALSLNMTFDTAKIMLSFEDEEEEVDYLTLDMNVVKVVEFSQMNDGSPDSPTRVVERVALTAESILYTYTAPKRSPKEGESLEFEHFLDPNNRP
ncbi:MAG: type VI secretion system tube protein Hcp [Paracoccaceae bacterium]|nr:type VI secretion system tube protein Hcp [Paracoccaceae bacterium]